MGLAAGRPAVQWMRSRNPWATSASWINTHSWRMCALGLAARWCQPEERFVIVTPGRAGSELLTDLLDSHPAIVCDAEILHDRVLMPERFVAGRSAKAGLGGARAYGFKLHCGHFGYQALRERPEFVSQLSASGVHLFLLRRENLLSQAVSSAIGSQTRWHWRRQDGADFRALEIDPLKVLMMMYLLEESDSFLQTMVAELPHVVLTYEDDLLERAAQQQTVDRICGLLGLPTALAVSNHVRVTPMSLTETVSNFDELAGLIRQTRFRRFLDERPIPRSEGWSSGSRAPGARP